MSETSGQDFAARRQLLQMQMLYEVGLALGESLDPAAVAQEILQRAVVMVDARAGALLLRDPQGHDRLFGHVGLQEPVEVAALRGEGRADAPTQVGQVPGLGDHVCRVPLRSQGEVHGLLVVVDKEVRDAGPAAFTDDDLSLLDAFALQAGAALRNARLHRDLQAAFDRIAQLEQLRALGDLAAEITHGMRHVLGLVVGHADAWLTLKGDPERAMSSILGAAEDGQALIERIHRLTRLGVGDERTCEGVNGLVEEAVTHGRGLAPADAQIHWDTQLAPDLPSTWLNREDVVEAVVNLLENAVHAVGEAGRIEVATRAVDDVLEIRVRDDGPGVADEVRERLFEPFVSTRGKAGSGLGLSIVYRVVEAHGGRIDVDSPPGQGATFVLRLPVIDTAPAAAAPVDLPSSDAEDGPGRR